MTNHRLANYNELLKDYVLKQDLKKNFTEYKNAADRKELFREVYLDLIKDGKVFKQDQIILVETQRISIRKRKELSIVQHSRESDHILGIIDDCY